MPCINPYGAAGPRQTAFPTHAHSNARRHIRGHQRSDCRANRLALGRRSSVRLSVSKDACKFARDDLRRNPPRKTHAPRGQCARGMKEWDATAASPKASPKHSDENADKSKPGTSKEERAAFVSRHAG